MSLAARLEAAWYRNALWLYLLRPPEWLYRAVIALRRRCYRYGWMPVYRAPVPVVVVGSILVGGTGKTPVVIALVEALRGLGLHPGVVSRGYGGQGKYPLDVTAASDPHECGDEPLLIARRTGAPCVVDPDRPAAVRALLDRHEVDIVLCDDGLQHYALARDMEIALLGAGRGVANGRCLPAGPLREPLSRLAGVDRVLRRGDANPTERVEYRPRAWVNLVSGEERTAESFAGESVYAIAGIDQPAQFFATLDTLGIVHDPRVFPDHHRYSREDFKALADRPILMTEKDAVKCTAIAGEQAWYLRMDAELPPDLAPALAALVGKAPDTV